jgi:hypothetical protein
MIVLATTEVASWTIIVFLKPSIISSLVPDAFVLIEIATQLSRQGGYFFSQR